MTPSHAKATLFGIHALLVVGCLSTPPTPVKIPPLAYFASHCSRCHGYYGANYGASFGKNLSEAKLREAVMQMAAGPGGAPLAGSDLDAEVAFHRSLVTGEPFLVWSSLKSQTLKGEVSPDASVTATLSGKAVAVRQNDTAWELVLPAKASAAQVVLKAKREAKTSTLDLAKASFTHAKP